MSVPFTVHGAVPYVFCADAGAISTWCQQVLGFDERERWTDDSGAVCNVELTLGNAEVWLDGPVPDWPERLDGLGSWIGLQVDDLDAIHTPSATMASTSNHAKTQASTPATSP